MNLRKSNFPSRFSIQFGEIGRLSLLHDQTCLFNFMAPSVTSSPRRRGLSCLHRETYDWSIKHDVDRARIEPSTLKAQSYGQSFQTRSHFGSINTFFKRWTTHPSTGIILTWFHVVNNDSRLTRLVRVKIQWMHYTSCESTSDSYTPDRWKNYRDSWRRHSPLYPPTPKQNRLCEKDSVSPKPTRYWFISKDGVVGGEEPIKAH